MPDLSVTRVPERDELRRQMRPRLPDLVPGLRIAAQRVLGAETSIDFVGVDAAGDAVAVLVGAPGEDLELVARGLAQRAWLAPRLADWIQLAPQLGLRPDSRTRVLLLCPEFGPEALAAASEVGPDGLWLARYRCVRSPVGPGVLLEPVSPGVPPAPAASEDPADVGSPPAAPVRFRSGLSDADLDLSPEELGDFEADRDEPPRGSAIRLR